MRRRNARLLGDADRAINETGYVPAGGIDHFVTIRGASHDNPVLVLLDKAGRYLNCSRWHPRVIAG